MSEQGLTLQLFEAGPDDPVFDALIVVGVVLICVLAVLGRHLVTQVLVTGYLSGFVGYLTLKGLVLS